MLPRAPSSPYLLKDQPLLSQTGSQSIQYLSTRARERVDSLQDLDARNHVQHGLLVGALTRSMDTERREDWLRASSEELVELVADSLQLDEYAQAQVSLVSRAFPLLKLSRKQEADLSLHSSTFLLAADPSTRPPSPRLSRLGALLAHLHSLALPSLSGVPPFQTLEEYVNLLSVRS